MKKELGPEENFSAFTKAIGELFLLDQRCTILYLIRHGQSEMPSERNHYEPPLTNKGMSQANQLGKGLAMSGIKQLMSGPSRRTWQTATILGSYLGLTPQTVPDLAEIKPTEDMPSLAKGMGEIACKLRTKNEPGIKNHFVQAFWPVTPGVETRQALRTRAVTLINRILAQYPEREIAIVTHFVFINAYLSELLGLRSDAFFFAEETAVSVVRAWKDQRVLVRLNDSAHHLEMPA